MYAMQYAVRARLIPSAARQPRNVVRLDGSIQPNLSQGVHHLVHVHVALVGQRLLEIRQRAGNIAEMNFGELSTAAEIAASSRARSSPSGCRPPSRFHTHSVYPSSWCRRNLFRAMISVIVGEQVGQLRSSWPAAASGCSASLTPSSATGSTIFASLGPLSPVILSTAIILAGTDPALIFNDSNISFPHVDCARAHLNEILRAMLD